MREIYEELEGARDPEARAAKVVALQGIIAHEHFGRPACFRHLEFLSRHLKRNKEGFEERSSLASTNRSSEKRRRREASASDAI
mmetsp:Transcript_17072/g.39375  ORF Transcript_17072/g.39375 Transcript_17072/m.39375 type:complete len:84 (-) Transcript_17072:212-463(-)